MTGGGESYSRKQELGRIRSGGGDLQAATEQWSTPNCPNGGRVLSQADVESRGATSKGKRQVGLEMETLYWPSPQERDYRSGETIADYGNPRPLNEAAVKWNTPHGQGNRDKSGKAGGAGGGEFAQQATNWATPTSHERTHDPRLVDHGEQLANQVDRWATPRREDGESCGNHPGANDSLTGQTKLWSIPAPEGPTGPTSTQPAESSETSPPAPPTSDGPKCWCGSPGCVLPSHKRKLNPIFETWLMGWPLWWLTSEPEPSGPWEMALYLSRQRTALFYLLAGPGWLDSERWPTPRVEPGKYSMINGKRFETNLDYVTRDWVEPK